MTPKRGLITDTFKVVKKARRGGKRDKSHSPPGGTVCACLNKEPEPPQLSLKEIELQELKVFDLDQRFGPCTGISRLQRWERAALHGMNPPQEIKDILLNTDPEYTQSLWRDYPL
ncbi:DNA polymerase delta subunit 4-like isoform X1 [Xyrauchen texanus]|uniref:DNA polymerase delta subunit 4-like isoform X1 n=1 Tax=Xyrauchen texanus TaxID=154827 RepID=UPI0022426A34|nr:DNA polymerase delta subunit 4-like isoform X1 [Xyrauchen texanus]